MSRRSRRWAACLVVVVVTLSVAATMAAPAVAAARDDAADVPTYVAPVDRPVVDRFRPPSSDYGPGNRGIDYATDAGDAVRASAPGVVVFAGPVGPSHHVVVLHPDGIRTSYSFLADTSVRRGQRVAAGAVVGHTAGALHFGARAGDAYVDPLELLGGGPGRVWLVPVEDRKPGSEGHERAGLLRFLGGVAGAGVGAAMAVGRTGVDAVRWARDSALPVVAGLVDVDELRGWLHYLSSLGPPVPLAIRLMAAATGWSEGECTPGSVAVPVPARSRTVVLVGGLGSASGRASVLDVDTATLGFAATDRVEFSYRGGDLPYDAADTQEPIEAAADHLRRLLAELARARPERTIEVIAHSQGGLVARRALADMADDPAAPAVGHLVTLGTPHHGSDVATALMMVNATGPGRWATDALGGGAPDPDSPSVRELSEASDFIRELGHDALPGGVRLTSIAARFDAIVPSPRSQVGSAGRDVVVDSAFSPGAHSDLPGSPAAIREIALALADMAPGCRSRPDAVADVLAGELISRAEDSVGAAANLAGHAIEAGVPAAVLPRRR
ncbi:MAG TPA: peptidoglycan DD-metalloendopeptidase family protein [Acidimicrobiales bacterium]|nr:peptidoglycan DD-metalloendopeptidase family protein [Acidimicrobiales bacterium]